MLQILCILIGRLLLMGIGAYELLQQLYYRMHALASRSYDYWQCDDKHEFVFIRAALDKLQKLPQHLVLVIAPDDCYVNDVLLKRIFGYAQFVGIPYLSVYDKRTPSTGYVHLSQLCQTMASDTNDRHFLWPPKEIKEQIQHQHSNGCCSKTAVVTNGTVNGYASKGPHYTQLQVYQIDSADGHALIADVCRELYETRKSAQVESMLKERQTLHDGINAMLSKRLGFVVPEPELGIVFARQTCTYGLLPWHVRFTEFHTHRGGRYFNAKSFVKILYKYARCEQRWGK
ncbi:GH13897 [Drosophila grimshawi]|uniref:ditrans,polycis-polyprenyl diphosphate synthase [(2E,6E)-farnesyldiphosphate specific] n=1 Tax=Drosophila grimshawi TaxID=7222 RepID=B4K2G1_DROGR|nr:GH13897 [Drosophila grimshawi]